MKLSRRYIFIVPTVVVLLSILIRLAAGPFWMGANLDPSYSYLLNGLHIFIGMTPGHIDHPGTPLQLLSCAVIQLLNMGQSCEGTIKHVIADPEFYLQALYGALLGIYFITSVILGLYIVRKTSDKTAAILSQLPALSCLALPSYTSSFVIPSIVACVVPELLLMSVANIFMIVFFKAFYTKEDREKYVAAVCFGAIVGFGIAVKFTFLPIIIVPLIILGWRQRMVFLATCVVSFIIWTIPIIGRYVDLWQWIYGLLSHTGSYGTGSAGFIDGGTYITSLIKMIQAQWFYVLIGILAAAQLIYLFCRTKETKRAWFILAAVVGVGGQFLIVAKHPAVHYLFSAIELCGILLVLLHLCFKDLFVLYQKLSLAFIIIFISLSSITAVTYAINLSHSVMKVQNFYQDLHTRYPDAIIINFYRSSGKEAALHAADNYGRPGKIREALIRMYPYSFYRNIWLHKTMNFQDQVLSNDLLASGKKVIFVGSSPDFLDGPYVIEPLGGAEGENAYALLKTFEKEATFLYAFSLKAFTEGDRDKALLYALKSKELRYQPTEGIDNLIKLIKNP